MATTTTPARTQTAEEIDDLMVTLWPQFQLDLAALSTNSTHTGVDLSGHFIQTDNPDAVVAATRAVLAQR